MNVIATCCVWSPSRPAPKEYFSAQRKWTQFCRDSKEDQKRGERRDGKRIVRRMWLAAVCLEKEVVA